jgi:hypothetical protein
MLENLTRGIAMSWSELLLPLFAVAIAALALMDRMLSKNLTIREHDEYRKGAERTTDGLQEGYRREVDRLEQRLNIIEATRPTAGELQQISANLKEQINEIKVRIDKQQ